MTKMSFMDKINVLIETSKSSSFFVVILLIIAFLAFILFTTNNKNKKTGQKIFISIYTFITLFLIIAFHESLGKMYTYMMNNLFIVIYFPNLAIYLAAIIVFVGRMFTNLAIIRRYYVEIWTRKIEERKFQLIFYVKF